MVDYWLKYNDWQFEKITNWNFEDAVDDKIEDVMSFESEIRQMIMIILIWLQLL